MNTPIEFAAVPGAPNRYLVFGDPDITSMSIRAGETPESAYTEIRHQLDTPPEITYRDRRHPEYPPIGDQLDAIAKGMIALRDQGIYLPTDTLAWLAKVEAVKAQYPKDDE